MELLWWGRLTIKVLSAVLLLGLFALACMAVMTRPFGLSEGWWALVAAGLGLATGLVSLGAAWGSLSTTVDVLLFFGGLLLLTAVLSQAGALDLLVDCMERWSKGSSRRLLVATVAVTALVTVLFSNDAAALLLAPALIARVRRHGLPSAPFLVAVALIANTASLVLPVSNPVNLLLLDRDHIPLPQYLATVTPAALVGLGLVALVVVMASWRRLPAAIPAPASESAWDSRLLVALGALLLALAAIDVTCGALGLPLGPPALAAGVLAAAGWALRSHGSPRHLLVAVPWSLLPLVAGFAVLAAGLERSGLLGGLAQVVVGSQSSLAAQFRVGLATAGVAGLLNNLPAAFLVSSGLAASHHLAGLVVPVIAGADLGPNLAPAGSLSTILIFNIARRHGESPPWGRFWRLGWVVGPVGLVASLGVLAVMR